MHSLAPSTPEIKLLSSFVRDDPELPDDGGKASFFGFFLTQMKRNFIAERTKNKPASHKWPDWGQQRQTNNTRKAPKRRTSRTPPYATRREAARPLAAVSEKAKPPQAPRSFKGLENESRGH